MLFDEHYTTIVIGAGPAGVMAALHAAPRGTVLLIEASKLPRDKSCGGMLNEYSQRFLADYAEIPHELFCEPDWIHFRYLDWDRNISKATSLRFANVDRAGFDEWLLGFLPDNVTLVGGTRFLSCAQDGSGVTVRLRPSDKADVEPSVIRCDYLIGCDGPRSQVRRSLPVTQLALYKTLQDYLPLGEPLEPYFDCVYARNIGKQYGYGYVIPKADVAIVGSVFFPKTTGCLPLHENAVELYRSRYRYAEEPVKREAWTAVQVRSVKDIIGGSGRVLLAGEAGGIMSPSSGEGISFALNSGKLAGEAVAVAGILDTAAPSPDGLVRANRQKRPSDDESYVLRAYRESLGPTRKNIQRRLRYFPIMNSSWGKWLGGYMPDGLIDGFTHKI